MTFGLLTGQRQGDLLRLRWDQIRDGWIAIRQSKGGNRVEIPTQPVEDLRNLLADTRAEANSTHVLVDHRGRPWLKRNFSAHFKAACREAGIERPHYYDLRGTCATALAEAGATHLQIATVTGHDLQTIALILKRYIPRTRAQAIAAMQLMGNYLRTDDANRLQTFSNVPSLSSDDGGTSA